MKRNATISVVDKSSCRFRRYGRPLLRASVKLFELGVRTPVGQFLGVWYAGGIDFRRFRTPSLPIFGVILGLGLLEATKMYK